MPLVAASVVFICAAKPVAAGTVTKQVVLALVGKRLRQDGAKILTQHEDDADGEDADEERQQRGRRPSARAADVPQRQPRVDLPCAGQQHDGVPEQRKGDENEPATPRSEPTAVIASATIRPQVTSST